MKTGYDEWLDTGALALVLASAETGLEDDAECIKCDPDNEREERQAALNRGQAALEKVAEWLKRNRGPYVCSDCQSERVEISLPCWHRESGGALDQQETDDAAEITSWYCVDCEESHSGSPERREA